MQEYIYNFLFSRTLSDLDELINIADDDRKDCLWEVRKRLLTARLNVLPTPTPELTTIIDKERLGKLAAELKDAPAYLRAPLGVMAPSLWMAGPPETAKESPSAARDLTNKFQHFETHSSSCPYCWEPGESCNHCHGVGTIPPKPAEKVTPKFQENCKDSVKEGRPEIGLYEPAAVYIDRVVAWERTKRTAPVVASPPSTPPQASVTDWAGLANKLTPRPLGPEQIEALWEAAQADYAVNEQAYEDAIIEIGEEAKRRTTPPHQDVAPSHRILFAGPGECLVCSTCLTRITDRDVEELGKNHDAEAYFCQRCIDFVEVRLRRLSTEEELDIETARLRKVWEEDKQRRDVHEAAVAAGRPFSAAREFMKKVDKIRTILSEPIKGPFHPVTTYLDPMGVDGTPIILPTSMNEESRTVAPPLAQPVAPSQKTPFECSF